jgi:hypothetical protein
LEQELLIPKGQRRSWHRSLELSKVEITLFMLCDISVGFGKTDVLHTYGFRNFHKIGLGTATKLNHHTVCWQELLCCPFTSLATLDWARQGLLLTTRSFKSSTWNLIVFRQKLKDGFPSPEIMLQVAWLSREDHLGTRD